MWKPIKDCKANYVINAEGLVQNLVSGKFIKAHTTPKGYLRVELPTVKGKPKKFFVHRLVAEAFIPNKNSDLYVNHIDGNKKNNSTKNLEWCSAAHNNAHAWRSGLKARAYKTKKLSPSIILIIRRLASQGTKQSYLASRFNVNQSTISRIISYKRRATLKEGQNA